MLSQRRPRSTRPIGATSSPAQDSCCRHDDSSVRRNDAWSSMAPPRLRTPRLPRSILCAVPCRRLRPGLPSSGPGPPGGMAGSLAVASERSSLRGTSRDRLGRDSSPGGSRERWEASTARRHLLAVGAGARPGWLSVNRVMRPERGLQSRWRCWHDVQSDCRGCPVACCDTVARALHDFHPQLTALHARLRITRCRSNIEATGNHVGRRPLRGRRGCSTPAGVKSSRRTR